MKCPSSSDEWRRLYHDHLKLLGLVTFTLHKAKQSNYDIIIKRSTKRQMALLMRLDRISKQLQAEEDAKRL